MYIYKASGFPPFFCNLIDLLIDDYLFMIHCIEPWKKESPRHHMLYNFYVYGLGILCFTTVKCLKDLEMKKNTV